MPVESNPRSTETPLQGQRSTVFFDGGCPMCRREIAHYQRLDDTGRIRWLDIHQEPDAVAEVGVSWETAMQRLHVRSGSGVLHTGVPAFVAIWRELPRYRWLARLVGGIPGLIPVLDFAYGRFARWRWQRRCRDGVCRS
jgi:predicted DCC family thiol-disulfide oxidoreductase YuxK